MENYQEEIYERMTREGYTKVAYGKVKGDGQNVDVRAFFHPDGRIYVLTSGRFHDQDGTRAVSGDSEYIFNPQKLLFGLEKSVGKVIANIRFNRFLSAQRVGLSSRRKLE